MMTSRFRSFLLLFCLAAVTLSSGCAVRSSYVKPDFDRTDRLTLKRLSVGATPLAGAPKNAAALLARMSRRFIHMRKDYIVVHDGELKDAAAWKELCDDEDNEVQGVVRVMMRHIEQDDDDLSVDMVVDLLRCDSKALVWKVELSDTNEKGDEDLSQLAKVYKREFGDAAETYAGPFFIAVQAAFDSLPSPTLTDEETMEKISMDEE